MTPPYRVQNLARSAAYVKNLHGIPVRVTAVYPGTIETGMTAGILVPLRGRTDLPVKLGSACSGCSCPPSAYVPADGCADVANAVDFLASGTLQDHHAQALLDPSVADEESYMTGQEMVVDNVISSSIPTGRLLVV